MRRVEYVVTGKSLRKEIHTAGTNSWSGPLRSASVITIITTIIFTSHADKANSL